VVICICMADGSGQKMKIIFAEPILIYAACCTMPHLSLLSLTKPLHYLYEDITLLLSYTLLLTSFFTSACTSLFSLSLLHSACSLLLLAEGHGRVLKVWPCVTEHLVCMSVYSSVGGRHPVELGMWAAKLSCTSTT